MSDVDRSYSGEPGLERRGWFGELCGSTLEAVDTPQEDQT